MNIREVYSAKAISLVHEEVKSNKIAYLGAGLFPNAKKMGLDLKHIRTANGLPVSLMPSAFDTVSTIRSREGFKLLETQMAYFKESMLVKEEDEQEIMRVQESSDPYAQDVLRGIFNDAEALIAGAEVVAERMRMSLLCSDGGHPSISISADGATYAYNYDPDNEYSANNYLDVSAGNNAWSDHANSDPMADIQKGQDDVEAKTGVRPTKALMTRATFNHVKANDKVRSYILAQNATANILVTDALVKQIVKDNLGVDILVYEKQYKNEAGLAKKFYADGFCTLLPDGALGKTWHGVTPDERTLMGDPNYDTKIVDGGIAVTVTTTSDPVHTKTTVSEILLPSFERMFETYTIKAYVPQE